MDKIEAIRSKWSLGSTYITQDLDLEAREDIRVLLKQLDNGGREAMLHDLLHYDTSAVNLRDYPHTEALLDQKMRSMTPVQKFWFETLAYGRLAASGLWAEEISSDGLYDKYMDFARELGIRHLPISNVFFKELKRLLPWRFHKIRKNTDAGARMYIYTIPPLEECRKHFENKIGDKLDWENLEIL